MGLDNPSLLIPGFRTSTSLHSHPDRASTRLSSASHSCLTQKNNVFISLATDSVFLMETHVMDKINNKDRIVHIVRQFSPAIGGLENFVKSLAKEQIEDGLDVEVVTLNRIFHQKDNKTLDESEMIEGIKVTRLPYKGSYKYPLALGVIKKIKSADIVHVHAVDFFADFLSLSKFIHKKPLVLSTHGGFFHTTDARFIIKLFFNLISRFTIKNQKLLVAYIELLRLTFDIFI